MENKLTKGQLFLDATTIPHLKSTPLTFLEISKQPHYENVLSNIYAFFFNVSAEHNLSDLFISSLLQLIKNRKSEKFQFNYHFKIDTEFSTIEKGRIDLLLSNSSDAIIIENKVYHNLNNNLRDYWQSVPQPNKQGVVLSLKTIDKNIINNEHFINITHLELLQCVMENLSSYILEAHDKYIIFLKDFYQNIINITKPMDEKIVKFYYKNQNEINDIVEIRNSFVNHIILEVEKTREKIDEKLDAYNNRNEDYKYYLCPNQGNLMITVVFKELFNGSQTLLIVVELQNELLLEKEKITKIDFDENEKPFLQSDFYTKKGSWAHFALQSIKLSEDDILNLSSYLGNFINTSPILNIYRKLKKKLVDEN